MSGKEIYNILVVDDERSMREFLKFARPKKAIRVTLRQAGKRLSRFWKTTPLISLSRISGCRILTASMS